MFNLFGRKKKELSIRVSPARNIQQKPIEKKEPELIGFTTLTTDVPEVFEMSQKIKQMGFPTKIVLGGVQQDQ